MYPPGTLYLELVAEFLDRPIPFDRAVRFTETGGMLPLIANFFLGWQMLGTAPGDEMRGFLIAAGMSGSGKTDLLRVLASEFNDQRIPVLVLDVHCDLGVRGLAHHQLGPSLGLNPLDPGGLGTAHAARWLLPMLRLAVPTLGHVQASLLQDALEQLFAGSVRAPRIADLDAALRNAPPRNQAAAAGLRAALSDLFGAQVGQAPRSLHLSELLGAGGVVDLSRVGRAAGLLVSRTILGWLAEALGEQAPVAKPGMLRLFFVVDEAAPLREQSTLDRLPRESRKFGLGARGRCPGDAGLSMRRWSPYTFIWADRLACGQTLESYPSTPQGYRGHGFPYQDGNHTSRELPDQVLPRPPTRVESTA